MITYKQLQQAIARMNDAQLNCNAVIHLHSKDEFYAVDHIELVSEQEEDRLDDGHPVLVVFDEEIRK